MNISVSALESLDLPFWLAFGLVALVVGATLLVWSPRRTSRALAYQRKSLQADAVLAGEQFDAETVTRLTRTRYLMMGALLTGMGAGLILSTLLVGLLNILSRGALQSEGSGGPAFPIQASGIILGGGIAAVIGGAVWRAPAGHAAPPALYQIRSYRQPWFFGLLCAAFLALVAISLLVVVGALPTRPQTLPLSWSLISIPAVSGVLAFAPEVLMRLIVRHPIWPDDLEPALALKAQGAYLQAAGMMLWGGFPGLVMFYLLLDESSIVAPFALAFALGIAQFAWVALFAYQLVSQFVRGARILRAALNPTPANQSDVAPGVGQLR